MSADLPVLTGDRAVAPTGDLAVTLAGEAVVLRADRTLFWPARGVLAAADLHWGKTETFQRFGLGVPSGVLTDDLARLGRAVRATGATQVLVLGDLVHGRVGLTAGVVDEAAAFLAALPAQVALVIGNHDRHLAALPEAWPIAVAEQLRLGPFVFRHEPEPEPPGPDRGYVLAGHLHPAVRVQGRTRRDGVRLPCFALGEAVGVLPAFSAFTGGGAVLDATATCYALVGDAVVPVGRAR